MEINRTNPRNNQLNEPAQKPERSASQYKTAVKETADPRVTPAAAGPWPLVTQADLADTGKTEETLARCFGGLVDDTSRQLGLSPSGAQRRDLVAFLDNDPLMRGKLLSYLEQIVK